MQFGTTRCCASKGAFPWRFLLVQDMKWIKHIGTTKTYQKGSSGESSLPGNWSKPRLVFLEPLVWGISAKGCCKIGSGVLQTHFWLFLYAFLRFRNEVNILVIWKHVWRSNHSVDGLMVYPHQVRHEGITYRPLVGVPGVALAIVTMIKARKGWAQSGWFFVTSKVWNPVSPHSGTLLRWLPAFRRFRGEGFRASRGSWKFCPQQQ